MPDPLFREIDAADSRALLERQHVGRLAFLDHTRVDIEPLHYVYLGDWIFCRTTEGTKTHALRHTPYVAFEVDEVRGVFDWTSVVARGTVYFLPDVGAPVDEAQYQRAVTALRRFLPETFAEGDPTPFRTLVFGIHVDEITGRAAAATAASTPVRRRTKPAR